MPIVMGLMQVGMTDTAVENFNLDIMRARIPALEIKGYQRRVVIVNGVAMNVDHVNNLLLNVKR